MEDQEFPLYDHVYFARQPIFDSHQNIWGYELLFRKNSNELEANISDDYEATLIVASSICTTQKGDFPQKVKLLINCTAKSIVDKVPYALPANKTVIQFSEKTQPSSDFLNALTELKEDGYTLAIDDYSGSNNSNILINYADFVLIDFLKISEQEIKKLCSKLRNTDIKICAKKIENKDLLELAQKLDIPLLQGYFFKKPEQISERKLSSTETVKLKIFKIIETPEPDFDALTNALLMDVSLSYRLLTLLNSPTFGFSQEITTVRQAIVLAGWKMLKNWLRVILLTDLTPKNKPLELPRLAVLRARFLAKVVEENHIDILPEKMFLLGLFSLLDCMFDMPMDKVTEHLPIDSQSKKALIGETNQYYHFLQLAVQFEKGNWDELDANITMLNLDPIIVSRTYFEANQWANDFFLIPGKIS